MTLKNASPHPFRHVLVACAALASLGAPHWVQAAEPGSRITQVKVYPGSATIERIARVAPGARSLTFRCLPAGLDAQSLQVLADANVRVGETSIQVQERSLDSNCTTPLDDQVRDAQDKLASAKAETEALELSHSYLKTVAGTTPKEGYSGPGTPGSAAISVTTDALRRSAQDTLQRLHQAKRKQEAAELALKALSTERDRIAGPNARVATVTVTLATERDSDVRLSYQVAGPSWSPNYRATLDTVASIVKLERLALVAQNTGEDWSNAQLTLSTGQPTRATSGRLPRPWTLDVAPLVQVAPAPAAAPMAASMVSRRSAVSADEEIARMPSFEVQTTDGAYATEFSVPQRISIPTGGQRVTLALGSQDVRAQQLVRTTPAVEPAAYLVAQLSTLSGVWPTASVALYRDNAYVGQGQLNNNDDQLGRVGLSFGRDERVVVTAEPQKENQGNAGITGARVERVLQRAFRVENRHPRPIALQVLDAAPVSINEQITVESRYEPNPVDTQWNRQNGMILWSETLAPGASTRFTASHTLRYAKDLTVQERR